MLKKTSRTRTGVGLIPLAIVFSGAVAVLIAGILYMETPVRSNVVDFCDYTSAAPRMERYDYGLNGSPLPLVDLENELYICVTPKSGITKLTDVFTRYLARNGGNRRTVSHLLRQFIRKYGKIGDSLPKTNFTKVFIYRNPVDRFVSLWQQKFQLDHPANSLAATLYRHKYRIQSPDLLFNELHDFITTSRHDPHVWPQVDFCQVDEVEYDYEIDVDDHQGLTDFFSQYWGEVDFEGTTWHSTKTKEGYDLAKTELRETLHLWREVYTASYWKDIEYYCKNRGNKQRRDRTH
ncbi:hypothetical protein NDN08_005268 [Rhodosorus marinus]|uniref:Sulfotransferase domain-containing protein n=1 Tax=Rhodosorus marinus TaxID=101924 RepID=A0AAV8V3L0_9RHOD|nr:hypothetical protein NDN08_005268 [Rhodosorus marinus]